VLFAQPLLSVNGDVFSTNISRVLLTADDCATREEKYDSKNKQTASVERLSLSAASQPFARLAGD
jgi:hypothetical protein